MYPTVAGFNLNPGAVLHRPDVRCAGGLAFLLSTKPIHYENLISGVAAPLEPTPILRERRLASGRG